MEEQKNTSRARSQDIKHLEAVLRGLRAQKAPLITKKETSIVRINEMQGDLAAKNGKIAELKTKKDDLLRTTRENKFRIDAFQRKLISNPNKFNSNYATFKVQAENWPELAHNINYKDKKMEEMIRLLTQKKALETKNKMLKLKIKAVLGFKYKEKYSDPSQ